MALFTAIATVGTALGTGLAAAGGLGAVVGAVGTIAATASVVTSVIGAVTGNKDLQKIGSYLGLAGLGAGIAGAGLASATAAPASAAVGAGAAGKAGAAAGAAGNAAAGKAALAKSLAKPTAFQVSGPPPPALPPGVAGPPVAGPLPTYTPPASALTPTPADPNFLTRITSGVGDSWASLDAPTKWAVAGMGASAIGSFLEGMSAQDRLEFERMNEQIRRERADRSRTAPLVSFANRNRAPTAGVGPVPPRNYGPHTGPSGAPRTPAPPTPQVATAEPGQYRTDDPHRKRYTGGPR